MKENRKSKQTSSFPKPIVLDKEGRSIPLEELEKGSEEGKYVPASIVVMYKGGEVVNYDVLDKRPFILLVDGGEGKLGANGQGFSSQFARLIRVFVQTHPDILAHLTHQFKTAYERVLMETENGKSN